ncbi:hypothetical protein ACOMHN_008618 [Nucella lapillus]
MDDGLGGRDIAPDEDRLNYVYPSNGDHGESDLVEDTGSEDNHRQSLISNGIHSRNGFLVAEPVDLTTDSADVIHNRVFPPQRQSSVPDFYKSERNRLATFSDWRHQSIVRKEDLAKNGFIYTGTGDKVRCVFCNGILRQWDQDDVVEQEHRRNFPNCTLLAGQNVGNLPLALGTTIPNQVRNGYMRHATVTDSRSLRAQDRGHDIDPIEEGYMASCTLPCFRSNSVHESDAVAGRNNTTGDDDASSPRRGYSKSPRNPSMAVEPERLATFVSWPAQMKQKPAVLAQAGLYYIGDGDKVKCFHCDVLLYNWEPEDDPYEEHARWFPDCQYLRLVKGENFVEDVKNGRATRDEVMQTPAVLAVLYDGHSVDSVQEALAAMKKKNGASVVVTAQNLLMTIMELEGDVKENVNGHAPSEDVEKLQRENESLRDKQLCKICMERDVEVIFLPCKHFVCCAPCSAAVQECPICRVTIQSIDKVFMV